MSPREREAAALDYFQNVARADREALLAGMCPDLRWVVPKGAVEPFAGIHEGAETVVDLMLGAVGEAFTAGSQQTEPIRFLHGEDLVAVEARIRARASDGRLYENEYVFFFEFRDGKISEIREYVDTRTAALFFGNA